MFAIKSPTNRVFNFRTVTYLVVAGYVLCSLFGGIALFNAFKSNDDDEQALPVYRYPNIFPPGESEIQVVDGGGDGKDTRTPQDYEAELVWFKKNKGYIHPNVTCGPRPDNPKISGIFTKGRVKSGDIVFFIPKKLMLDSYRALEYLTTSDFPRVQNMSWRKHELTLPYLLRNLMDQPQWPLLPRNQTILSGDRMYGIMALFFLVNVDNKDHPWAPFFKTLPRVCPNAFCWPPQKLYKILSKENADKFVRDQAVITSWAFALGVDEYDFLRWYAVYTARHWMSQRSGGMNQSFGLMAPLIELVNHKLNADDNRSGIEAIHIRREYMSMRHTSRTVGAGVELFWPYGKQSTPELLEIFGFHFPENVMDTCQGLQKSLNLAYIKKYVVLPPGLHCDFESKVATAVPQVK
eukprot:gb/GEZN01006751.1/.p1 GENE.gb/GEZN01006751.1/~~gb/GEZN01006751.1/.p1  ORF type:complete len:407 (-),score=41.82 gb/GEZN01006751.1/:239-1459(-)